MWRILAGLIILNILFGIVDVVSLDTSDYSQTKLTAALSSVATTITVNDTSGFRVADYVVIGDEVIQYSGKTATTFTNCVRPSGTAHQLGANVYSRQADAVRSSVGYNLMNLSYSGGLLAMPTFLMSFVTRALPQMVTWNYSFLKSDELQYLRLILQAISAGIILYYVIQIVSAIANAIAGLFT